MLYSSIKKSNKLFDSFKITNSYFLTKIVIEQKNDGSTIINGRQSIKTA